MPADVAIDAIHAPIAQLDVIVLAGKRFGGPPFAAQSQRAGPLHDTPPEALTTNEIEPASTLEHFHRHHGTKSPHRESNDGASMGDIGLGSRSVRHYTSPPIERANFDRVRSMRVAFTEHPDAVRATQDRQPSQGRRQNIGCRSGRPQKIELRRTRPCGEASDHDTDDGLRRRT